MEGKKYYLLNVIVDDKSKFSKGHCNEKGFVRLFTLVLNGKEESYKIKHISINGKLVSEKFSLSAQ